MHSRIGTSMYMYVNGRDSNVLQSHNGKGGPRAVYYRVSKNIKQLLWFYYGLRLTEKSNLYLVLQRHSV